MWDLPGPGLEPVSPALAGRYLTTAPPGKSATVNFVEMHRFLFFFFPLLFHSRKKKILVATHSFGFCDSQVVHNLKSEKLHLCSCDCPGATEESGASLLPLLMWFRNPPKWGWGLRGELFPPGASSQPRREVIASFWEWVRKWKLAEARSRDKPQASRDAVRLLPWAMAVPAPPSSPRKLGHWDTGSFLRADSSSSMPGSASKLAAGASLVAQWLRICLLMQGTRV